MSGDSSVGFHTSYCYDTFKNIADVRAIIATGLIILALGGLVCAQTTGHSTIAAQSATLSGNVKLESDSSAAGGGYVQFTGGLSGGGGCGLTGEVFCENFEGGISSVSSRSGDINPAKITGGRQRGEGYRGPNYILPADIPACRVRSATNPLPPKDALICDPVASRNSHHALIAVTSQNYGDAEFRVNQPFDFAERTGKIRTDISLHGGNGNGAPEIIFSDQPQAVASINGENGKGTALSNGFIIHFRINCTANSTGQLVRIYDDYAESILNDENAGNDSCASRSTVRTSPGKMNRVELRISKTKLEIWATDYSEDGVTFGSFRRVFSSVPINLSFTRGWYSFGGHNHATIKYEDRISHNT